MSQAGTPTGQGGQAKPPRVFVVDDHPLVRSGVRSELEGRVDVVGTAGDVDEAVAASPPPSPTSCSSTSTCPAGAAPS